MTTTQNYRPLLQRMHQQNIFKLYSTVAAVMAVPGTILQVKKLTENAKIPTRGSPDAAGFDIYAGEDTVIPKGNAVQYI